MTIREAIKKLQVIHSDKVHLKNGTHITLIDLFYNPDDPVESSEIQSLIKVRDGERIFRRIYASIWYNEKTNVKSVHSYCKSDSALPCMDGIIPERTMNEFINDNGGIDTDTTIYNLMYYQDCLDK
mgnify:CR=1 FL=1